MVNHLDQSFLVEGTLELDTYYNYGFRDYEGTHFVVRVRPDDGNDTWYIYLNRRNFSELFDDLKEGKQAGIAQAVIPSEIYEQGQGNLAIGEAVQYISKGN